MRTVAQLTEGLIKQSSYLEEALTLGIVNLTALARRLKPKIEEKNLKKTSVSAIVMALQRLGKKFKKHNLGKLKIVLPRDLTVKSNLVEYVYRVSPQVSRLQAQLSKDINHEPNIFFSATVGIFESTVIVSESEISKVERIFKQEHQLLKLSNLSALTLRFAENTIRTAGVYYFILKALAWENVSMAEVISVGSELTLIFEGSEIEKAFPIVKGLIK